jgi:hypothetical protein
MASIATTSRPATRSRFKHPIGAHLLLAFFILAYALSWPYMIVDALGSHGVLSFRLPMVLWIPMGYGPTHLLRKAVTELPVRLASERPIGVPRAIEENTR